MSSSVSWLRGLSSMDRNVVVAAFMARNPPGLAGVALICTVLVNFGSSWGLMCWDESVCVRVRVWVSGRERKLAASLLFGRGFSEARIHPRLPRSVLSQLLYSKQWNYLFNKTIIP